MRPKWFFTALLFTLCSAGLAVGQTTEKVTLYADVAMSDCSIAEVGPGIVEVHMFHVGSGGRVAVEFLAPKPACWTGATWVGDIVTPGFLALGSTQAIDYSVAYGGCLQLPVYLGRINYFVTGAAEPCCPYPVLPTTYVYPPMPQSVLTVDCANPSNFFPIGAGGAMINENVGCPCQQPVSVEQTTWGRVKALYGS